MKARQLTAKQSRNILFTVFDGERGSIWNEAERETKRIHVWREQTESTLHFSRKCSEYVFESKKERHNSSGLSVQCFEIWGSLDLWPLTHTLSLRACMTDAFSWPATDEYFQQQKKKGRKKEKRTGFSLLNSRSRSLSKCLWVCVSWARMEDYEWWSPWDMYFVISHQLGVYCDSNHFYSVSFRTCWTRKHHQHKNNTRLHRERDLKHDALKHK